MRVTEWLDGPVAPTLTDWEPFQVKHQEEEGVLLWVAIPEDEQFRAFKVEDEVKVPLPNSQPVSGRYFL